MGIISKIIPQQDTNQLGGKPVRITKFKNGEVLVYNSVSKQWEADTIEGGGGFTGTMDDISDGTTYVKTENNLTDALVSAIGSALQSETSHADVLVDGDIGVTVAAQNHNHTGTYEPADATILKDADIGVNVQAYNANTVIDASYVHTDNNYTDAQETAVNSLVLNNFTAILPPATTDDTTEGYAVGSKWVNINTGKVYECVDASEDTAVWIIIPTVSDVAYDATTWDNNTDAPTKNAVRDKFESLTSGSGLSQAQVLVRSLGC